MTCAGGESDGTRAIDRCRWSTAPLVVLKAQIALSARSGAACRAAHGSGREWCSVCRGAVSMPVGTIKKLVQEKGFGFISQPQGDDVFFHHSAVENRGFEDLQVGQSVEFQIDSTPNPKQKGPRAKSVSPR